MFMVNNQFLSMGRWGGHLLRMGPRPSLAFRYLFFKFSLISLGGIAIACGIIFIFDLMELVRRGSDLAGFSVWLVVQISALRVLQLLEQALPFIILFASIAAFWRLTGTHELIVMRATGLSIWQFILPPVFSAFIFGILAILLINPLAVIFKERSDMLAGKLFNIEQTILGRSVSGLWLRQRGDSGEFVLYAQIAIEQGRRLFGVTIFAYDGEGNFLERVEAKEASLEHRVWRLYDAVSYLDDGMRINHRIYEISTELTSGEVSGSLASPDGISFLKLRKAGEAAERAGLPAYRYELQFQQLLARPLLLVVMTVIAASVSLRVQRFGGLRWLMVGGAMAGFVLYIFVKLAEDLGGAGIIPPLVAAWTPVLFGLVVSVTILLHLEDG